MNKIIIEGLIKIKQAVRELGLHNDDKNAQFGAFASEAKLIETFDKAVKKVQEKEKDFTATVITLPATIVVLPNHQNQVSYKDKYGNEKTRFMTGVIVSFTYFIYVNGESYTGVFQMSGEDDNDMSFAAGKAATYGKRIFLLKLMDLTSAGLDPERVENKRERAPEEYKGRPSRSPEAKAAVIETPTPTPETPKTAPASYNDLVNELSDLAMEKPAAFNELSVNYSKKTGKILVINGAPENHLKVLITAMKGAK